jgi:hypothetical protein
MAPFGKFGTNAAPAGSSLRLVTWNVAAVNNNPFEYWISHPDPAYKSLMEAMERFIVSPGENDVRVDTVFTDTMFQKTMEKMRLLPEFFDPAQLVTVEAMWNDQYRARKVVSGFLTDKTIGSKRLASMPDRVTNTIQSKRGNVYRPAVTNCYGAELRDMESWFDAWLEFFFDMDVELPADEKPRKVYSMLTKIRQAKYPAVTTEEEEASVPLQIVLQGVFDAVLLNFVNSVAKDNWQKLRKDICSSLNLRKNAIIMEILRATYGDADVLMLQEAGNNLIELLRKEYGGSHLLLSPKKFSAKRNQNSVILLRRDLFSDVSEVEIALPDGLESGDLLLISAVHGGEPLALASFHGDTQGLQTIPMLQTVLQGMQDGLLPKKLVFGMDANTHVSERGPFGKTQAVAEFEEFYLANGLRGCWGQPVDANRFTTFNARTYLQPQLNKAAKSHELVERGDRNPKDFVLFSQHFKVVDEPTRDNTGKASYIEEMVFPTLDFPSDHAAISMVLRTKRGNEEL